MCHQSSKSGGCTELLRLVRLARFCSRLFLAGFPWFALPTLASSIFVQILSADVGGQGSFFSLLWSSLICGTRIENQNDELLLVDVAWRSEAAHNGGML